MSKISIISFIVILQLTPLWVSLWCLNGVLCVPCTHFKEAMLTHLFNYIYDDCKQLLRSRATVSLFHKSRH